MAELSQGRPFTLVGSGAALLADFAPLGRRRSPPRAPTRAMWRAWPRPARPAPLKPLYLRAPDAKLPRTGFGMKLIRATAAECAAMAGAHAQAFEAKAWREDEFEDLLEGEGIYGFLADDAQRRWASSSAASPPARWRC